MDDREIRRILGQDFSAGAEGFRDALLASCLDVLAADDVHPINLDDDTLEMLAAAGAPSEHTAWELPG